MLNLTLLDNESIIDVTYDDVVNIILDQNIVSIFQGRSEAGPRALGNRTITFDPRNRNGKDIVNTVKMREGFRPFAASVMLEHVNEWFDMAGLIDSPFMMFAVEALPGVSDKVPSVIHADNSCRIQTVTQQQNYHWYHLIKCFHEKTGVPMLFNTSFNLAGETIVETLDQAVSTLRRSKMEYLWLPEESKIIKVPN
jgi:carbamoyltransferase